MRQIDQLGDRLREDVDEARLQMELRLRREAAKREVVVLEAADEEALRKTHARYFKSAQALVPPSPEIDRAPASSAQPSHLPSRPSTGHR
jgi:hypothetical protein